MLLNTSYDIINGVTTLTCYTIVPSEPLPDVGSGMLGSYMHNFTQALPMTPRMLLN
jgi:hypothetical protein